LKERAGFPVEAKGPLFLLFDNRIDFCTDEGGECSSPRPRFFLS
jgi:hypothetical protein